MESTRGLRFAGPSARSEPGDGTYVTPTFKKTCLFVKKGERAFKIAVYSTLPLEKKRAMEKALAQQVLAKL